MIQLPQLHESLLIANERLVDRARRRARLFRTGLMSSAAVVSIGGVAAAGIAIWHPQLGHEDGNRPSISAAPVPAGQAALLGVLRRDQTAADRGAVAQQALITFSSRYRGVRLAAVRTIYQGPAGTGIVLLPVADLQARDLPGASARTDSLCAYASVGGATGPSDALTCFGDDEIRRGRVSYGLGDLLWAIVPDGVSTVDYHGADGADHALEVRQNTITVSAADVAQDRADVQWRDADARPVTPAGGVAMRLQTAATPNTTGFQDCGPGEGGIVPVDVRCGAEGRRWTPPPGTALPDTAPKAK